MTDFTREWIAKREQLEQTVTEGPWVNDGGGDIGQHYSCPKPWATIVGTDVACMSYCYGGSGVGVEREEDAEFIADARTSLPAALAALRAVLEETDGRKRHYGHALLDGDHCSACLAADIRAAVEAALRGES